MHNYLNLHSVGVQAAPDSSSGLDLRDRIAPWPCSGTLPFMAVKSFLSLALWEAGVPGHCAGLLEKLPFCGVSRRPAALLLTFGVCSQNRNSL